MAMNSTIDLLFSLAQQSPAQNPDQGNLVLWAILLLGFAVLLFFLEIFIPSGGIIGMFSAFSLIAGVVMLFRIDTTLGLIGAIAALASLPFLFAFALKIWPHTPIGRMLTLGNPNDPDATNPQTTNAQPDDLVGKKGKALTDLRPVGTCLIEGKRIDCIAQHGLITQDTKIRVITADGIQIKVVPDNLDAN